MLCYRCGSNVPDLALKCSNCGAELGSATRAMRIPKGSIKALRNKKGKASKGVSYDKGDLIAGRYEVESVIGKGPFGTVFHTFDKELESEVAVKVWPTKFFPNDNDREQFEAAVRQARRLSQQNIVRLHDSGFDEGGLAFVAMQRLEGLDFRKVMSLRKGDEKAYGAEEIAPFVEQLVQALAHCHRSTFHGDLKPENIILQREKLKLTDFNTYHALSHKRFLKGNKGSVYLAPEVVADAHAADARSDVYSLGVIVAEALSGEKFKGSPTLPGKSNESLPDGLDDVIEKALSESPKDRFESVEEFKDAFDEVLERANAISMEADEIEGTIPADSDDEETLDAEEVDLALIQSVAPASSPGSSGSMDAVAPPSSSGSIDALPASSGSIDPLDIPTDPEIGEGLSSEEVMVLDADDDIELIESQDVEELDAEDVELIEDDEDTKPDVPVSEELETIELPREDVPPAASVDDAIAAVGGILGTPGATPPTGKASKKSKKSKKKRRRHGQPPQKAQRPPSGKPVGGAPPVPRNLPTDRIQTLPKTKERGRPVPPSRTTRNVAIIAVVLILGIVIGIVGLVLGLKYYGQSEQTLVQVENFGKGEGDKSNNAAGDGDEDADEEAEDAGLAEADASEEDDADLEDALAESEDAESADAEDEESALAEADVSSEEDGDDKDKDDAVAARDDKKKDDKDDAVATAIKPKEDDKKKDPKEDKAKKDDDAKKAVAAREPDKKAGKADDKKSPADLKCPGGMSMIKSKKKRFEPFCVDRYEFPGGGVKPQTNVSWFAAESACKAKGKRLCAIKEWQRACGAKYPWGRKWDPNRCNTEDADELERSVKATGSTKTCRNGWGLYDMVGNVSEWVQEQRVVGGDATSGANVAQCYWASNKAAGSSSSLVGFRCCADPK